MLQVMMVDVAGVKNEIVGGNNLQPEVVQAQGGCHKKSSGGEDESVSLGEVEEDDKASIVKLLDGALILDKEVGRGQFGRVFAGKYGNGKRKCAAKFVGNGGVGHELEVLRACAGQCPFIVQLFSHKKYESEMMFVLEYCENGDLFNFMQHFELKTSHITLLAAEIALALEFLHKRNILYLDLKPENVGLTKDFQVKLLDFGLSVVMDEGERSKTAVACGTLHYCAPEVFRRENCTAATDWWSFGILLYELLFEHLPFQHKHGETDEELCIRICSHPFPVPVSIMEAGNKTQHDAFDLIVQLLHKESQKRLGFRNGVLDIQPYKFFEEINWSDLWHDPSGQTHKFLFFDNDNTTTQ